MDIFIRIKWWEIFSLLQFLFFNDILMNEMNILHYLSSPPSKGRIGSPNLDDSEPPPLLSDNSLFYFISPQSERSELGAFYFFQGFQVVTVVCVRVV